MVFGFLVLLTIGWWCLGMSMLWNVSVMKSLRSLPLPEGRKDWPSVVVLSPARNEAAHIREAMEARLCSSYPALKVVLINDRSTDETGCIADELADTHEHLQVLHLTDCPDGWLGKVHALQQGVEATSSEWLLFSDADVSLSGDCIERAVYWAEQQGFDVLAAIPTFREGSLLMNALHALMMRLLYGGLLVRLIERKGSKMGVGVGAFTLVRRSVLGASPGLAAIRMEVADDLMLGRMLKHAGASCSLVNGAGVVSVSLYESMAHFVDGAEKNAWAVSARFSLVRGLTSALVLLAFECGPWLLLWLSGSDVWFGYALACVAWSVGCSVWALRTNGRSVWGGFVYPLGALCFAYAAVRGTLLGWWRGGLQWRGSFYATSAFLEAQTCSEGGETEQLL